MVDIEAVRDWLGRLPGGSLAGRYTDDWDAFAKVDRPVLTLFGSYDTGKSSLLRRLLADAGHDVPEWLTISARHETFQVGEAELNGCVVRDTPGFAVGASDIRARNNSHRAMSAVGLTDVGIAVLPPQLATSDHDLLRRLAGRGWPSGSLWFVISRFDEAGVSDPADDPEGYRSLRDRKVRELREMFTLDDRVPVFVVSPDPFQLGPDTWDDFRDWDGMTELGDAVAAVSPSALPGWRDAAGQRYWAVALDDTLAELRTQLTDYTARAATAAEGVDVRRRWESELDTLDQAAVASLDGLVEEVMRTLTESNDLEAEVQRTLEAWFARHEARLDRLRQSIRKAGERERARPSWAGFASLVETVESGAGSAAGSAAPGVAGHFERVGPLLLGALKAGIDASGSKSVQNWGRHLGTAEAALPLVVYLARAGDGWAAGRAAANQDRAAAEKRRQVAAEFTSRVRDAWQPFVDEVRDEIVAETGDQVELDASLRGLVAQLREAVAEGERLSPAR